MEKFGNFIAKHRKIVLLIATLLLLPAIYGNAMTKINYEILTYLPEDLESVKGQDVLSEVFNDSANGMLVIENMEDKEVVKTKEKIKEVEGVRDVIWIDDFVDISILNNILPEEIKDIIYRENSTLLLINFEGETSSKLIKSSVEFRSEEHTSELQSRGH